MQPITMQASPPTGTTMRSVFLPYRILTHEILVSLENQPNRPKHLRTLRRQKPTTPRRSASTRARRLPTTAWGTFYTTDRRLRTSRTTC